MVTPLAQVIVHVGSKRGITIPLEAFEAMRLQVGDWLCLSVVGDGHAILERIPPRQPADLPPVVQQWREAQWPSYTAVARNPHASERAGR